MEKVFIGAPVRNRGWVLPRHLDSVLAQTDIDKEICYILNDSEDDTEDILRDYGATHGVRTVKYDLNATNGHVRGQYSYKGLANLRNRLLDEFLKSDCDYLLSIDTDIIIPKGSIKQLIDNDKDICSMLLRNNPHIMAHNIMNNGVHLKKIPLGVIPVDLTGAVYLIKREVVEAGCRYAFHRQGEDFPFCGTAKKKGFEIYCDTRLRPIHAFEKGVDLIGTVTE